MEDFIKDLQSFDPGVPDPSEFIRVCPPPNKGGTHTEEAKRLISEAMRGRIKSKEEIEKIKNALTGKPKCATHGKNVSKAQTGEKNSFYGKKHSDETRAKMRVAWERRRAIMREQATTQ